LKELDREDARKSPGGIVLRMTWMCSPGISGEGELRGQPANPQVHLEKWPLKRTVCCGYGYDYSYVDDERWCMLGLVTPHDTGFILHGVLWCQQPWWRYALY